MLTCVENKYYNANKERLASFSLSLLIKQAPNGVNDEVRKYLNN